MRAASVREIGGRRQREPSPEHLLHLLRREVVAPDLPQGGCHRRRQASGAAWLQGEIAKRGTIEVLRHGIRHGAHDLDLFYGTPSPGNEQARDRFERNRFTVTRQLRYYCRAKMGTGVWHMKFKPPIIESELPTAKQIAKELKRRLYTNSTEPEDYGSGIDPSEAKAITIPSHHFHSIAGRKRIDKHLYWSVEYEASKIGIVVGFGVHAILIGTDASFYTRWEQPL